MKDDSLSFVGELRLKQPWHDRCLRKFLQAGFPLGQDSYVFKSIVWETLLRQKIEGAFGSGAGNAAELVFHKALEKDPGVELWLPSRLLGDDTHDGLSLSLL